MPQRPSQNNQNLLNAIMQAQLQQRQQQMRMPEVSPPIPQPVASHINRSLLPRIGPETNPETKLDLMRDPVNPNMIFDTEAEKLSSVMNEVMNRRLREDPLSIAPFGGPFAVSLFGANKAAREALTARNLARLRGIMDSHGITGYNRELTEQTAAKYPRVLAHQSPLYMRPDLTDLDLNGNLLPLDVLKARLPRGSHFGMARGDGNIWINPSNTDGFAGTFIHELTHGAQNIGQKAEMGPSYQASKQALANMGLSRGEAYQTIPHEIKAREGAYSRIWDFIKSKTYSPEGIDKTDPLYTRAKTMPVESMDSPSLNSMLNELGVSRSTGPQAGQKFWEEAIPPPSQGLANPKTPMVSSPINVADELFHGSPQRGLTSITANPTERQFPNGQSQLGAFFTPNLNEAQRYADINRSGTLGGVYQTNLNLKRPYEMRWGEFGPLSDITKDASGKSLPSSEWARRNDELIQQAQALREQLQAAGHDGVIIRDTRGNIVEVASFQNVPVTPYRQNR